MVRCRMLAEVGRRQFLRGSTTTAAGAAAVLARSGARRRRPRRPRAGHLPGEPARQPGRAQGRRTGRRGLPGPGRAGRAAEARQARAGRRRARRDVVGFTTLCPHKGYPLRRPARSDPDLLRPLLALRPEKGGLEVWGHATQNLPQYQLRVEKGDVYAEGIDELPVRPAEQRARVKERTMAYKRNVDRLPIIPADAKEHNVVCHYCIVGCGYKAYTWDVNRQGGTAPDEQVRRRPRQQQEPETPAWYSPSMYNIVSQDGRDVHLVVKPDKGCVVNGGLGSIRGARIAEMSYSAARHAAAAAHHAGGLALRPDAADLLGRRARPRGPGHGAVIKEQGEDGLFVSASDHGGAGGGYEFTWGTGKLYFGAMKVKNIRIHNRRPTTPRSTPPATWAWASSTTATRTPSSPTRSSPSAPTPRDPDQLLPRPLGPEPARHLARRRSARRCRTSRTKRAGSSSSTRAGP